MIKFCLASQDGHLKSYTFQNSKTLLKPYQNPSKHISDIYKMKMHKYVKS